MTRLAAVFIALSFTAAAAGGTTDGGSDLFCMSGYNMFRYSMWGMEGRDPSSGFDLYNRVELEPSVSDMLSAKLSFDTRFGFSVFDSLAGSWPSDDYTLKLVEAYGVLRFSPEIYIAGGRFKLPFGHGYNRPGSDMPFYGRAMAVSVPAFTAFGGKDLGIMLGTDLGPVDITLSYTNGTDSHADSTVSKQFTADVSASPAGWISLGGSAAVIGQPEMEPQESWSATGLSFYAYGDYPILRQLTLNFEGEYMSLPWAGPAVDDMVNEPGGDYYFSLAGTHEVEIGMLTAVQPAVRFEVLSPPEQVQTGQPVPESDVSALDMCLNLHTGQKNTVQIGARSYSFQSGADGYTDVYVNWRMLF